MKLRDTAVSSALCRVLKYNQPVSLLTDFDSDDDLYKNITAFCYISSKKPSCIHHSHNEKVKPHRKVRRDPVLYRIDMVENGQPNLLFMNVKGGYMKSAAVNTEGRDMREVMLKGKKAFYSEAYAILHIFELHDHLYKM